MQHLKIILTAVLILTFSLSACAPQTPATEPTVSEAVSEAEPTNTPEPTDTPTPTSTATSEPALALESTEFELVPNWEAGEVHQYEQTTTKIGTFTGEDVSPISATTPFTISVLEADSDGYVLEWQYQETYFGDLGEILNELPADMVADFESMFDLAAGLRVEYDTLPDGRIFSLRNTEEIKELNQHFIEILTSVYGGAVGDQETEDLFSWLFDDYFTDEMIEASALEGPVKLHSLYGGAFNTDTPIQVINTIADPFGISTIETLHEYEVVEYDPNRDIAVIQGSVSWEPEQLEQMMVAMMSEIVGTMGEETEGMDFSELIGPFLENLTIETTIYAEAELSSGWITLYETITRIDSGLSIQEETITIRRAE